MPAAHSGFFARSCPCGPAAVITYRANAAVGGETDDGSQRAALDKITAGIAAAGGPALPGILTVRAYACGKPGCRCHADPPRLHGPYAEWTRKIAGKTVTRRLTPAEREFTLAGVNPALDDFKDLAAEMHQGALASARDAGRGWPPPAPASRPGSSASGLFRGTGHAPTEGRSTLTRSGSCLSRVPNGVALTSLSR